MKAFGICLLFLLAACSPRDESPIVGSVVLGSGGTAYLPVSVSQNREQPWRLRFYSPDVRVGESAATDKVAIYLRNDDGEPLTIYLGKGKGKLTIQPNATEQLFNGTLDQMFLLGRTEDEELTLLSSKVRNIKATFKFVHELKYEKVEIKVSLWFLHYGL